MDIRSLLWTLMFLFKNPNVWFAFLETESMWGVQERLSEIVTPRYLAEGTDSKTVPCKYVSSLDGTFGSCDM